MSGVILRREGDKIFTKPLEFDFMRNVDPVREKNLEDAIYINN